MASDIYVCIVIPGGEFGRSINIQSEMIGKHIVENKSLVKISAPADFETDFGLYEKDLGHYKNENSYSKKM